MSLCAFDMAKEEGDSSRSLNEEVAADYRWAKNRYRNAIVPPQLVKVEASCKKKKAATFDVTA